MIPAFSFQSVTALVWRLVLTVRATPFPCLYLLRLLRCCLYDSLEVQTGLAFHGTKTLLDQKQNHVSLIL